jgi:FkbM family methyltransferase
MIRKFFNLLKKVFKFILHGKFDKFLKEIPNGGVIHVGANTAQERNHYKNLGIKYVVWIEADPELFEIAKKNISKEDYENHLVLNYLVTDKNDNSYRFNITNNGGNASSIFTLKKLDPGLQYIKTIELKSKTLSEIVKVENIDLEKYQTLVIDAEGSEKLILDGAKELFPYLKNIKLENGNVNFFKEENYNEEIHTYLKKFNFIEKKRTEIYKNSQGKLYDILYSKI